MLNERQAYNKENGDQYLDMTRNAALVAGAEKYYRAMYLGSAASWNLRDTHMFETLQAIIDSHKEKANGPKPKAVIWAHNSHVGDARATEMGQRRGELNLGQLCRERLTNVQSVGFGTATGKVAAADNWGGAVQIKSLRDPLPGSFEKLWSDSDHVRAHLSLDDQDTKLVDSCLQRAVGVIYRPETERISHYYNSCPAQQFKHYIWFKKTNPVTPLEDKPTNTGEPE